jgi:hypothetical protein
MRLLVLMFFFISFQTQAATIARVDKTRITLGQSIQLKISSDDSAGKSPNIMVLKRSFRIIGNSKISRVYLDNGVRKHRTLWFYILKPKTSGNLQIPVITVNRQNSRAIKIQVTRTKKPARVKKSVIKEKSVSHDIVVSASLNKTTVYPNEILIYTLSVNFPNTANSNFKVNPPFTPGAIIIPLAKPKFQKIRQKSKPRTLRTQSFAIFANDVSYYQIKPASISLNSDSKDSPDNMTLKANDLHFEIQPKANQTSLGYWLPSPKISLTQQWSDQQSLSVGSSITRTIELQAYGLNADVLPLLSTLTHDSIDIKLLDVQFENTLKDGQLVALRREKVSLTFNSIGSFSIEPIDIHWWNTQFNQARVTSLAPQNFNIKNSLRKTQYLLTQHKTPLASHPTSSKTATTELAKEIVSKPSDAPGFFSATQLNWIIVTLFSLLVATTAGWLVSSRKKSAS